MSGVQRKNVQNLVRSLALEGLRDLHFCAYIPWSRAHDVVWPQSCRMHRNLLRRASAVFSQSNIAAYMLRFVAMDPYMSTPCTRCVCRQCACCCC